MGEEEGMDVILEVGGEIDVEIMMQYLCLLCASSKSSMNLFGGSYIGEK